MMLTIKFLVNLVSDDVKKFQKYMFLIPERYFLFWLKRKNLNKCKVYIHYTVWITHRLMQKPPHLEVNLENSKQSFEKMCKMKQINIDPSGSQTIFYFRKNLIININSIYTIFNYPLNAYSQLFSQST